MRTKFHCKAADWSAILVVILMTGCTSGGGNSQDEHWFNSLVRALSGPTPSETARQAFNSYNADRRREAINRLADAEFGGEPAYLEAYRLLLQDADPTVRAAAAKALSRHGTVEDAGALAKLLQDESSYTRWAAAQALRRLHNPQVTRPLIDAMMKDEDADVRIAAADGLGQYTDRLVYDSLVAALSDGNFGVATAARRSLQTLTGRDLGSEPGPWVQWAQQNPQHLFDGQKPYTYRPYQQPRSWWDEMQFWESPPEASERPIGAGDDASQPALPSK